MAKKRRISKLEKALEATLLKECQAHEDTKKKLQCGGEQLDDAQGCIRALEKKLDHESNATLVRVINICLEKIFDFGMRKGRSENSHTMNAEQVERRQ